MQVTNRKERKNAKWRFAGLYILSLAIPILLIFNAIDMGNVESQDTAQFVEQLRKRDQALAELSRIAVTLHTLQQIKPAYLAQPAPENKAKYEQLNYEFETGVNDLKRLYFSDTTLYGSNYQIVDFLDSNHDSFNQISEEFKNKVEEGVNKYITKLPPSGGGNPGELIALQFRLQNALNKIKELQEKNQSGPTPIEGNTFDFADLRTRTADMNKIIDEIDLLLGEIESGAGKIQRRDADNLKIRTMISDKVKSLKRNTINIRTLNNGLMNLAATSNHPNTQ